MRISVIVLLVMVWTNLSGQHFQKSIEVALPDSVMDARHAIVDLDNDGLLDVVLLVNSNQSHHYIMFIKGDTINSLSLATTSIEISAFNAFGLTDYDNDNQLDIIFSTSDNSTFLLRNTGGFTFERTTLELPPFSLIAFSDLDNDAAQEIIVSGEDQTGNYFTRILGDTLPEELVIFNESQALLSDIELGDFDKDGLNDLFITGRIPSADSVFSILFIRSAHEFVPAISSRFLGESQLADVNLDGRMDIIISGKDHERNGAYRIFRSQDDSYAELDLGRDEKILSSLWADLNSDGKPDESFFGINSSQDSVNLVAFAGGSSELLPHSKLSGQLFGDLEHDGDLDLFQLTKDNHYTLVIYENVEAEKNLHPSAPKHGIAVPIYGHTFIYWQKAADDHTAQESITYDLFIGAPKTSHPVNFDLVNETRMTSSHGNNLTVNYKLLNGKYPDLNFAIQSVDNSLHAGKGSVCFGTGTACVVLEEQLVSVCYQETTKFDAPVPGLWFSFLDGYLGSGSSIDVNRAENDTIFYFKPDFQGCSVVTVFPVNIAERITVYTENLTACAGSTVALAAPSGWNTVSWHSNNNSEIVNSGPNVSVPILNDDIITASYKLSETCTLEKDFVLKSSVVNLEVSPSNARIYSGSEIKLTASGADHYEWSPSDHLSNANSAEPVATPPSSIIYTVTGYDSIGCSAVATINIFVESSGFIPTLFTPNADGNNDELKVYGLTFAKSFQFQIMNREGKVVYNTNDLHAALSRGWDGSTNGVRQPSGIYFWRVEGSDSSGQILLDGKKEGSFLLIR